MIVTRGLGRAVVTGAIVAAGLGLNVGTQPPQPPVDVHTGGAWHEPPELRRVQFTDDEVIAIVQMICTSGILES